MENTYSYIKKSYTYIIIAYYFIINTYKYLKENYVYVLRVITGLLLLLSFFNGNAKDLSGPAQKLPSFSYNTINGEVFTNDKLKKAPLMIVYFNPACDICQKETQMILENLKYFNDKQIIMVSPSKLDDVKKFIDNYKLSSFSQITVLHDKGDVFYKQFDAIGYPSVYLYDENQNLITYFEAETKIEEIQSGFELKNSVGRKN